MSNDSIIDVYTTNPGLLAKSPLSAGHVQPDQLPWAHIGMDIYFKVVSCCNKTGRYVVLSKYPPGTQIPPHRHSGQVIAITLQGKWKYLEQDFIATPGSIAFEVANSNHTLKVLDDSEEEMILLAVVEGSLITYGEDGSIWAIDDAQTHLQRYLALCKEQGLSVDESLIVRS